MYNSTKELIRRLEKLPIKRKVLNLFMENKNDCYAKHLGKQGDDNVKSRGKSTEKSNHQHPKMALEHEQHDLQILHSSSEPVVIHDENLFLYVNPAFVNLLGGTGTEEYIGKSVSKIFPSEFCEQWSLSPQKQEMITVDGIKFQFEVISWPTWYQGKRARQMLLKDVFPKITGINMEDIQRNLIALANYTTDSIIILDKDGRIVDVNRGFELLHGWTRAEVVGKISPAIPKHWTEEAKRIRAKVLLGETIELDIYKIKKDGTTFPVNTILSPFMDSHQNIMGVVVVERDITEKKLAEERLRLAQLELETTVRNYKGVMFTLKNIEGRLVFTLCDGDLLHRLGYTPEQIIGKETKEIFCEGNPVIDYFERAFNVGERISFEGSLGDIPCTFSLKPLIVDSNVIAVVGHCMDISNRLKGIQALQESEERYRVLVEALPEPVMVLDEEEYKILFVNMAAVQLFAASDEHQVLQKSVTSFILAEQRELFVDAMEQLLHKGIPLKGLEQKLVRFDGKMIDVEIGAISIHYFGKRAIHFICRDITTQKQSEEILRESDQRYRRLLKLSPEPVVIHDGEFIIYANDAAVRLVDASNRRELIGKSILKFIHPDYYEHFKQRIMLAKETTCPLEFVESKILNMSNKIIDIEASSTYVYKNVGIPVIQTAIRDISERKRTEEIIIRSEKLSVIGQLAAGVAHEIRNPLTSLKGFTQLLKSSNKANEAYYDLMLSELERINNIVNEFMMIARPHNYEFADHDLLKILNDVVLLIDMQAILNNVEITKDFVQEAPMIKGNQDQLKQVFINILKNAIEAMPQGGNIHIVFRPISEEQMLIRIIDHGMGIPQEMLSKIGEPFFTTKENGTGLGLMICNKIIEAHHGRMHVASRIGEGTTIDIILPIA